MFVLHFLNNYVSFSIKFQVKSVWRQPSYEFTLAENNLVFSKKHVNYLAILCSQKC